MINHVNLAGNLTKDSELRSTPSGTSVLQFSIAVNERVKQGDQWVDKPGFYDLVMFGKRAEGIAKYLTKGAKVAVDGKLRWSQWEAKDGGKRSKVEIVVDEIEFMSARSEQTSSQPASQPEYYQATYYDDPYADESIPF